MPALTSEAFCAPRFPAWRARAPEPSAPATERQRSGDRSLRIWFDGCADAPQSRAIMRHNVLIYGGTLHGDRSQIARNAVSGQFPSARRSDQMPACRATHREYNTHVNIARRDLFKYAAM